MPNADVKSTLPPSVRLITFPDKLKSCVSVSVSIVLNIVVRSTLLLLPLIVITLPAKLSVWSVSSNNVLRSTVFPPLILRLLFALSHVKLCVVACTFAGVNVNTPALSYAKLPLPLGVAVVILKSVNCTLLFPPPVSYTHLTLPTICSV